tara:strand:+ start:2441 stop:2878 length:438 start_codon:yes stop_codon:yes gene_type:complete
MILEELKTIKSGRHERHQFGVVMAIAAFIIGGILWWRKDLYSGIFIAGIVCVAPVVFDKICKTDVSIVLLPFQKVWMSIAVVMGTIVSTLFLSLFFYVVFTSIRFANRFLGKPLLENGWAPESKDSYWIRREGETYDPQRSEKQY